MHHTQADIGFKFDNEIAVGDSIQTIPADIIETEFFRNKLAVYIIGYPGQCTAAQGHHIRPFQTVIHSGDIPVQHFKIGQEVMRQ